MAQTGYTPISIYYSATATNVPTAVNLVAGELAINTADGKLFYKDSSGVVQTMASKATGTVAGSTTQVIYNNAGAYAGSANLTFDGTTLTANALKSATLGSPSATALTLQSAGTTAVTVTTAQNVGIGTSSPAVKLDVVGSLQVTNSSGSSIVANRTSNPGSIELQHSGVQTGQFSAISGGGIATYTGSTPTEAMRIDSSGNLLVGTTSSSPTNTGIGLTPAGNGANQPFIYSAGNTSSNSQITYAVYSTSASQYQFYVGYGGTVYARSVVISALSDERLKENIVDLDVGLDKIMALKPRKFDWKEGKGTNQKNVRGFIAQEIEQVFPDLIDEWRDPAPEGEEPYKSLRQDLIPVLVKAIQELNAKVDAQATTIAELQAKVA